MFPSFYDSQYSDKDNTKQVWMFPNVSQYTDKDNTTPVGTRGLSRECILRIPSVS